MVDFKSVLAGAQQLTEDERLQLINALWETLPGDDGDEDFELSAEWKAEIERRVAEIENGTATLIPWETVRDEALKRITNGNNH